MPSIDFSSCWAKIDRAQLHRDALNTKIDEHFKVEANWARAVGNYDADSKCHIFRLTYVPENLKALLLDVSLSVGDIAHNLRSALDHLAYQLALAEARGMSHRVAPGERRSINFPIHTTRRRWLKKENEYVGRFGHANATLIKSFQPYRGRAGRPDNFGGRYRHQLTLLNAISNRDKHRLPNVIAAQPNTMMFTPPPGYTLGRGMGNPVGERAASGMKLGAESTFRDIFSGPNVADIEVAGDIIPAMSFPDRGRVIPAIDRIAAFVIQIVGAFDPRHE